jgi:hypothetical protein
MARPPVFPAEEKVRIVLSILAGEITVGGGLWQLAVVISPGTCTRGSTAGRTSRSSILISKIFVFDVTRHARGGAGGDGLDRLAPARVRG